MALVAIALLAGLTAAFASADVASLAARQRADLTKAIAVAAGSVWDRNNTWSSADLSPELDVATRTGLAVQIRDQDGRLVAASPSFSSAAGPTLDTPVVVDSRQVGSVLSRATGTGLNAADRVLQTALLRAIAGAAGLAALLALLTGIAVARRITRPVTRLIAVTRAMAAGNRAARAGQIGGPGELRELAAAFDQMAGALDRQEQIRRNLVADVAHELRTPIAILQAGHEALLDGVAEPTPAELGSLRDEVLRLARMVGDLQTLAAADAAALQPGAARVRPGRPGRGRGRQPGRAGSRRPGSPLDAGAGALLRSGRSALAAPGDHQPAHQRAEVHPGRRPGHHRDPQGRPGRRPAGHRHRRRHPGRGPAAHLRPVLARPPGGTGLRQRHRPGRGRRAGPGPRRPTDRRAASRVRAPR